MTTEYSFREYLKDDGGNLLRIYLATSWGFMAVVAGAFLAGGNHPVPGVILETVGFVWLLLWAYATRPRCI